MQGDKSVSSVYFMLAVSSHVSMQGHHCLPLRVWLWGKCVLCVTVEVITDVEGDHTIGETFPLFSRNRSVCVGVCFFFTKSLLPRVQCGGKDEGDKANGLPSPLNDMIIWTETWTWHSQHYYQFFKESGCWYNQSLKLWSHNHFHWSPPLQTFLFKLIPGILPGSASPRVCIPIFLCWRHLI